MSMFSFQVEDSFDLFISRFDVVRIIVFDHWPNT